MAEYIVEVSEWVIDANGNPPFGKCDEIIRCRDCMFFLKGEYCWVWADDKGDEERYIYVEPDGFCAWSEPKVVE